MTDKMTTLRDALNAARSARLEIGIEQQEARSRLIVEMTERLEKRFGARMNAATAAEQAAQTAFYDAVVAKATVAHADKLASPDLLEWDDRRDFVGRSVYPRKLTGRHGRWEIWTATSTAVGSRHKGAGDCVIRVLKKDGTPSQTVVVSDWDQENLWFPEGTKPKGAADD